MDAGPGRSASAARPTVALDGRGADRGAEVIIEGARAVARDGISVRVFGDQEALSPLDDDERIEMVPAPGAITNDDEPVASVRSRKDASVVLAAADVAEGRSNALVSAGPTGATMTAALFALRRIQGVRRPALTVQAPALGRDHTATLVLDVGANSEARAGDLVQFAYLGSAFAEVALGVERPRVALLSIGEEASKGTLELIEAHAKLREAEGVLFIGNVEGRDLLATDADVVVTDGFTGNVALKTLEGTAKAVGQAVGRAARSNPIAAIGGLMMRPALGGLRRELDPDGTGGAILLGLDGVAIVAHGSSGATGIANAIRLAARAVEEDVVNRTAELMRRAGVTRRGLRDDEAESEVKP